MRGVGVGEGVSFLIILAGRFREVTSGVTKFLAGEERSMPMVSPISTIMGRIILSILKV